MTAVGATRVWIPIKPLLHNCIEQAASQDNCPSAPDDDACLVFLVTVPLMQSCLPEHTSRQCTARYKAGCQAIVMDLHMQHPKMIDGSAMGMIACSPLRHEMQLSGKALACIPADHVTWKSRLLEGRPAAHTSVAYHAITCS